MAHPAKTELASLHFLILSAEPAEAAALAGKLGGGAATVPFRAASDAAGLRALLRERSWDVVLYLYGCPALTAPAAMKLLDAQGHDLPFIIVVADPVDEKAALRAMRAGAHDVVFRDRLDRLLPAIDREVHEACQRADHRAVGTVLRNKAKVTLVFRQLLQQVLTLIALLLLQPVQADKDDGQNGQRQGQ